MKESEKRKIFQAVQAKVRMLRLVIPKLEGFGACVHYAAAGFIVLLKNGISDIIPQGGTMNWPRIKMEDDDGVMSTHFGYVYENNMVNTMRVVKGVMPEMHVWLALRDSNEIVDFSTAEFPEQCRKTAQMEWTGPKPPDFLWERCKRIPENVLYRPDKTATLLAVEYIKSILHKYPRILRG